MDFPSLQVSQALQFDPAGSVDRIVNFTVTNDDAVECEESFRLTLISLNPQILGIDPVYGDAVVSIIDDDGLFYIYKLKVYFINVLQRCFSCIYCGYNYQ